MILRIRHNQPQECYKLILMKKHLQDLKLRRILKLLLVRRKRRVQRKKLKPERPQLLLLKMHLNQKKLITGQLEYPM